MAVSLSKTQRYALKGLADRTGSGAITKTGTVLAAGEIIGTYYGDQLVEAIGSATWARLMTLGMVEPAGPNRIRITDLGRAQIVKTGRAA